MARAWLVVVVVSLLGCQGAPCRSEDVERVVLDCHVEIAGPAFSRCVAAGLTPPSTFSWTQHSVDNCSNRGSGRFIACLAARSSECRNGKGGVDFQKLDELVAACQQAPLFSAPPPASPSRTTVSCQTDCEHEHRACLEACPTETWEGCTACASTCFDRSERCFEAC